MTKLKRPIRSLSKPKPGLPGQPRKPVPVVSYEKKIIKMECDFLFILNFRVELESENVCLSVSNTLEQPGAFKNGRI